MIVPIQRWGIGDIIFEMTLVKAFNEPIMWVVELSFLEGLKRAYPDIQFTHLPNLPLGYDDQRREDYRVGTNHFLPLRWADVMLNLPYMHCMKAKYLLYGLDWQDWKRDAMFQRDKEQETRLQTVLGIRSGEPYNLINRTFRTNNTGKADILYYNGLRNIEMSTLEGFSLFDWAAIIENATEIHTVSTSIIYILELLELKIPIHLYPRLPDEGDFKNVDYLFTKPYILH